MSMTVLTHYDTLGVKPEAGAEEIKKAYRRLAARTHPDVGGEVMAPLFLAVQAAFETLGTQVKRDAYDHELKQRAAPASKPSAPAANPTNPAAPAKPSDSPAAPRTIDTPAERIIKDRVPAPFWVLLLFWAAALPALAGSEMPSSLLDQEGVAPPAGAGTLIYAGLWLAGLLYGLTGRTGRWALLPFLALATGAGAAWGLHEGAEMPVALHALAGLGISVAAGAFARRRRNLARMGIKGKAVPRTVTFKNELRPEDAAAQRRTYRSFGALLTQPGTRILENASVAGRVLQYLIVNGDRAAVVDSRAVPGWSGSQHGDLESSFAEMTAGMRTTLVKDMASLDWVRPENRTGWVAVHPAVSGSVRLSDASGSRLYACSPAEGAEQIHTWLAEGSKYGLVDPHFIYRLVHEGITPLRHYRHR